MRIHQPYLTITITFTRAAPKGTTPPVPSRMNTW